jgi:hypothetical protein
MPSDLHVHFRLSPDYARKLCALADATGTSPSVAARHVLIEVFDSTLREELVTQMETIQEELASLKAAEADVFQELKNFRAEFLAALRRAGG